MANKGGGMDTVADFICLPVKEIGLIPWWGRSPGGGNDNPLQYSCLENSMDRGVWQVAVHGVVKSWTWLTNWAYIAVHKNSSFSKCLPTLVIFCFFVSFLLLFLMTFLTDEDWHFDVILLCISLIISDAEHLFIYLVAVCMSSYTNHISANI